MRDTVLGLGILVLFIGIVVFPITLNSSPSNPENTLLVREKNLVFPDWEISAPYNKSEILLVYFSDPVRPGEGTVPDFAAYMYVNVTDPNGGVTTFNVTFLETTVELGLLSNDGGLLVQEPVRQVGGLTKYEGNYTARVYTFQGLVGIYYSGGKMTNLELWEAVVNIEFPYLMGLPIAASMITVGILATLWGARTPKRRLRPKRKRWGEEDTKAAKKE